MSLILPPGLLPDAPRPRVEVYPAYALTHGAEVVELLRRAGKTPDPWQHDSLMLMCAVRPDGKWSCFEYAEWVSRQNGKGVILEARALAGLFLFAEELIMWSAHEYKTAMEAFRRIVWLLGRLGTKITDNLYSVDDVLVKVINTNGEESIERLDTGQRIKFIARSKGSGRGFAGDINFIDESFAYTREQQDALMPTMSARPNPQLVYTSSPPLTGITGDVMFGLKARAEAGGDDSLGYRDWGLDGDLENLDKVNLDDEELWRRTNPSLGQGRLTIEFVRKERRSMGREGFARERMGIWPRRVEGQNGVIAVALWADLADRDADRPTNAAFTIDVAPDRRTASIAMVGVRDDGLVQVAVVEHRPGTDWIPARAKALDEKWDPICWAVDGKVAAETLGDPLAAVGITVPEDPERPHRGCLVVLGPVETAAAWALFVDAANQRRLRHSDDVPLNLALGSAKTRPLAGGLAWAQQGSDPICPLVGVTNGLWAEQTYRDLVAESDPGIYWL